MTAKAWCFNTQPPEGGCELTTQNHQLKTEFQHTAARRRLHAQKLEALRTQAVSTHSRPKAAANCASTGALSSAVSTHSRPKAAAATKIQRAGDYRRFNTQPPEGGCNHNYLKKVYEGAFQHTAARRRLLYRWAVILQPLDVSTHSRPKAAASVVLRVVYCISLFQHTAARRRLPITLLRRYQLNQFQHTAARRRLLF